MSTQIGVVLTMTTMAIGAGANTVLIAANPYRKYLALMNTGTGRANLALAPNAAVLNAGWPLAAASAAGDAGGGLLFDDVRTTQGFNVWAATATTIVVLEGG